MEVLLALTILFLALIIAGGLIAYREHQHSKREKLMLVKIASHKRAIDSMKDSVRFQSEHLKRLEEAFTAIKEYAERSREFSERASLDLEYLKKEFEVAVSYRKQSLDFDHVEGL